MFIFGLGIVSLIFTIYMVLQYKMASSPYFFIYAIIYGALSHGIWVLSIKNLDAKNIFIYGFIWDLVLTCVLLIVPFLVADINLTKYQIAGITLMIIGSLLLKISN